MYRRSRLIDGVEVEYDFEPGTPGHTTGAWEDCVPPEGPEIEIVEAFWVDEAEAPKGEIEPLEWLKRKYSEEQLYGWLAEED